MFLIGTTLKIILGLVLWPLILFSLGFYCGHYYATNKEAIHAKLKGKAKTQQELAQEELERRLKEKKDDYALF